MTGTEISQQDRSDLTLLPPARPLANNAVETLMRHTEAMNAAHRVATVMCNSAMVPSIYRGKPDDGAAAILYGGELGLNPIQSLQNIFPVHGMPSMYAKTMAALVKRHGYKLIVEKSTDEEVVVRGIAPDGQTETSSWTIERAIKAGYVPTIDERTGKYKTNAKGNLIGNEKYLTDPRGMLYAKCVAEVCRHLAPDVLLGIAYTYEELLTEYGEDSPRRVAVTTNPAAAVDDLRAALNASKPVAPEPTETPDAPVEAEDAVIADPAADPAADPEPAVPATDPTSEQYAALSALFAKGGMGGKSVADKAKRELVASKLLDRNDFAENPLTGQDVELMVDTLTAVDSEGDDKLATALTQLAAEVEQ